MREVWDRVGISASLLCVIHCLLTPVLVMSMPVVGEYLSHEWFHILIFFVVVPVAVWALWSGYQLHKLKRVLWLGALGLIILSATMLFSQHNFKIEIFGMVTSGFILALAHMVNLRACRLDHR